MAADLFDASNDLTATLNASANHTVGEDRPGAGLRRGDGPVALPDGGPLGPEPRTDDGLTVDVLTGIVVPVVLGLVSAFGDTAYTNHLVAKRETRKIYDVAEAAIRGYANALGNYSNYLEEVVIAGAFWDPTKTLMETGSADKIRAAWLAAQPYFHRLQVEEGEKAATSQNLPDGGAHAMEGADNFYERAQLVRNVLDRGLLPRR